MGKDLLLEVGCEEIPAGFLGPALARMEGKGLEALDQARIGHGESARLGTPRRLALAVSDLAESQQGYEEKRLGPLVSQAFDDSGAPTKAGEGFARSCGAALEDLGREPTKKGDKLMFVKKVEGKPSKEVLAELLPDLIRSIEFPKSMKWGAGTMTFARPIHWVVALFGDEVIEFELGGIRSGAESRGHRFMSPEAIEVSAANYINDLYAANVTVDPAHRRAHIEDEVTRLAGELGGEIIPDFELLDEVTNLVEKPVVIGGGFDRRFLALPAKVPIAAMRTHQRYFAIRKPGTDRDLMPHFITVANTEAKDMDLIARGNERVLAARLADAEFYWDEDKKTGIEKMRERTAGMVFYKTLGTYMDKTGRLEKLCETACDALFPGDSAIKDDAVRAARYSKADLTSQMVGEFPELQGEMGGEYARAAGFSEEAAIAIRDHYLPRSAEDIANQAYPANRAGVVLSICDKLDSVVACWAAGLAPTGAGDPFALRRQAQGVINLVMEKGCRLDLKELVSAAAALSCPMVEADQSKVAGEVVEFIKARLRGQLIESGVSYDVVDACLAVWNGDINDTGRKIEAVSRMKERDDFDDLMIAFRRVMNIVEGEPGEADQSLFEDEHEAVLYSEYTRVERFVVPLIGEGGYQEALDYMAGLKPAVDSFFDNVMVNVDDPTVRRNRHALCDMVADVFKKIADFSLIVIEGERADGSE